MAHSPSYIRLLGELNERVERRERLEASVMAHLYHDWLWGSDGFAKLQDELAGMNAMHMYGVLFARAVALVPNEEQPGSGLTVSDLAPDTAAVQLYDGRSIDTMSARELRDVMEACQLHWGTLLHNEGVDAAHVFVMRLVVRFGWLASHACTEEVHDDRANRTAIPVKKAESDAADQVLHIYTVKALRTHVDILYVMLRGVEIARSSHVMSVVDEENAAAIARGESDSVGSTYVATCENMVKSFHVESSLDEFNVVQQMFFLAPAQRLVYAHTFAGMLNDVSQVVYFHYPQYVRSAQLAAGQLGDRAMNALPCVRRVVPQISIVYDDEARVPLGRAGSTEWLWVVSLRRVYLWDGARGKMWRSAGDGLFDLFAYYLLAAHGLDFFRLCDDGAGVVSTASQKIRATDFAHARVL